MESRLATRVYNKSTGEFETILYQNRPYVESSLRPTYIVSKGSESDDDNNYDNVDDDSDDEYNIYDAKLAFREAVVMGSFDDIKAIWDLDRAKGDEVGYMLAYLGRLDRLKWLMNEGIDFLGGIDEEGMRCICGDVCSGAVRGDRIEVLEWAVDVGGFRADCAMLIALEDSNLAVIKFLSGKGYTLDESDIEDAMRYGDRKVIKWLSEQPEFAEIVQEIIDEMIAELPSVSD